MLVDSHCHLDTLIETDNPEDLLPILQQAKASQVDKILCVCIQGGASFDRMLKVTAPYDNVLLSCGLHPLYIDESSDVEWLHNAVKHNKIVAIGETGLDFYHTKEKNKQIELFEAQLQLSKLYNKAVIVHSRSARLETVASIQRVGETKGVLHCFTETDEMAKKLLDLGYYISISGIITFKNASALRDVVKSIPLSRLLIETDSPYLAPVPYRGKKNYPAYVYEVAKYIAELKNMTLSEVAEITTNNFNCLFL